MKKSFSKKFLSLFISAAMLVTSLPAFAISAQAENTYNFNYKNTPYVSDATLNHLVAQFNFDSDLNGVDAGGNTIAVTPHDGISWSAGSGTRLGVAQIAAKDSPGAYADVNTNPLSGKDLSDSGTTVSFWQYQLHDKDTSNYGYNPVVTFYQDATHYVAFTYGGYVLYADGASGGSGIYRDYKTDGTTDIAGIPYDSTTVTAMTNNIWCHYGFSVTNNSVSIYVDGVRYDYTTSDGSTSPVSGSTNNYDIDYSSATCIPTNILKFLTDSKTVMSIGSYKPFPQPAYTSFIDDVRVYDKALTQVELRSLYGENDDTLYAYASGHDPTVVENVNYGKSGYSNEYRYYMFGTGMTIYGSNDLSNWTELGDSHGRTGYQNEEYWGYSANTGGNYMDVLTSGTATGTEAPLKWSTGDNSNDSVGTGSGKLVWAPSVYYNTNTKKYMMVSATSSWGSSVSCIFTAESNSIEGPYYNITPLMYSGFHDNAGTSDTITGIKKKLDAVNGYSYSSDSSYPHRKYLTKGSWISGGKYTYTASTYPNCIDPCPFYGADGNLYMSLGSWSGGIYMVKLTDDGFATDSQWMYDNGYDPYFGKKIAATTTESLGGGSGEGSFVYYNPTTNSTYLNVVYGSVHRYQYTMRVWKNNNSCPMAGSFTDVTGAVSTTANSDSTVSGMKLMGNYTLTGSNLQYYDNGHCSYIIAGNNGSNDAGKTLIAYHVRIDSGTITERALASTNYLNASRVHQVLYNRDGWECVLPYQYSGETFNESEEYEIAGTYSILDHGSEMTTDFKSATRYTLTYADETTTTSGNISNMNNESVGKWSVENNYLSMTINDREYKGCLIKMNDELGSEKLVFSAVGVAAQNTVWGVQTGKFNSSAQWSNPDAELSIDPEVYVHSEDGVNGAAAANYYGTEISDGTYHTNNTCNVYIADGWTIDSVVNADGNSTGEYYQVADSPAEGSEKVVNGVTCKGYYLGGHVSTDPQGAEGYDLALKVTYHNDADPTVQYVEKVYTWVRSSSIEAHSVGAGYIKNGISPKYRSVGMAVKLNGSEGSADSNGTNNSVNNSNAYGIGNYRSVDDFTSKSNWVQGQEVDNSSLRTDYSVDYDAQIKAGSFAISHGTSSNSAPSTAFADVKGTYYLDMSSDSLPEGASVDTEGKWSVTASIAGVPEYRGTYETQYISSATASDNINWSVTDLSNTIGSSYTITNYHSNPGSLQEALYTASQSSAPAKVYNSTISGTGTVTDSTITIIENHASSNPYIKLTLKLKPAVYVYNKGETRNALEAATSNELESNKYYTEETCEAYDEAIRVANAFVNNVKNAPDSATDYKFENQAIVVVSGGKTYNISTNGVTRDGETIFLPEASTPSSQSTFKAWIEAKYNALFSVKLYDEFNDTYDYANNVISANGSGYTEESFDEFSQLMKDYDSYSTFINDVDVEDGQVSWRDIADTGANANNYNAADTSMTAKQNYETAVYNLKVAIAHLRVKADYTGLESEITSDNNTAAQANGLYIDNNGDGAYDVDEDTQCYTISTWLPYSNAYDAAVSTDNAQTANDKRYADRDLVITNDADSAQSTTVTTDNISYNDDKTAIIGNYSEIQNKIFHDTNTLNEAVNNLKEPVDYENYNIATDLLKYQDIGAFTPEFINDSSSPYGIVQAQGTREKEVTYDIGAEINSPVNCITPNYNSDNSDELAYVIYDGTIYKNMSSQAELDAKTSGIISALNEVNNGKDSAKRATYQVTFVENFDGEDINTSTQTAYYGETLTFTPSQGTSYKWNIVVNDSTSKDIPAASSYTLSVQGNTTITAFTRSDTVEQDTVSVKIQNAYGIVNQEYTVSSTSQIILSKGSYGLIGETYLCDVVPFYEFSGWNVNEKPKDYGTYNAADLADDNGVIVLRQKYSLLAKGYKINLDGEYVADAAFDKKVTITSNDANAYAIAFVSGDDYYVVSYGNEYTFYAIDNADYVTITKQGSAYYANGTELTKDKYSELIRKLDAKLAFVSAIGKADASSFSIFSAPSLGSVNITEYGTIYANGSVDWDEKSLVIGGTSNGKKAYKVQAKNPDELTQQYFLKVNTTAPVVARSYVKYSFTVNGTTVQTIDYGNIVRSN
ncbi:MAG: lipocalin-like domain-containing protein [Eubacterium sp.]